METPSPGVPAPPEWSDIREIIEELIGRSNAPLRQIVSAPQTCKAAGDADRWKTGIDRVSSRIDHARQRLTAGVGEDRGSVEALILDGDPGFISRIPQTNLIDKTGRE